jgi:hypothetical protein
MQAQALLRQAHQMLQQAGAADADTILAELNSLTDPPIRDGGHRGGLV